MAKCQKSLWVKPLPHSSHKTNEQGSKEWISSKLLFFTQTYTFRLPVYDLKAIRRQAKSPTQTILLGGKKHIRKAHLVDLKGIKGVRRRQGWLKYTHSHCTWRKRWIKERWKGEEKIFLWLFPGPCLSFCCFAPPLQHTWYQRHVQHRQIQPDAGTLLWSGNCIPTTCAHTYKQTDRMYFLCFSLSFMMGSNTAIVTTVTSSLTILCGWRVGKCFPTLVLS